MSVSFARGFRPSALYLFFFAVSVAAPASAHAQTAPRAALSSGIQAAYDGLGAAFRRHDLSQVMAYFTDDFFDMDEKGTRRTKEDTRQAYQKQLGQMKTIQSKYVILRLVPAAGGTLVEMKMHSTGTGEKRVLFARLRGTFADDLWVRDLWIRTPQGWRIQHRQTLQDDIHIHPG